MILAIVTWWRLLLAAGAWWFGGLMLLSAYHWPRSPAPGLEFVRDIMIPVSFALLAVVGIIAGFVLL